MVTGKLPANAATPAHPYQESPRISARGVSVAIGNLRAFVTLMVLAQHAMLAYHPFAPAPEASLALEPRSWLAFPIVDSQRSSAFLVMLSFNDIFGMSLMFFLSGLFVWPSQERKGSRAFLRGRFVRLGVPFLVAATLLTPLAYYPSYLVRSADPSLSGFWDEWFAMGIWPGAAGPAWFLWLLLAFDGIAAALFTLAPRSRQLLAGASPGARDQPAAFFGRLVLVSVLAYVPLAIAFGAGAWNALGPFKLQTSRALHYLVYFMAGVGVGIDGIDRGLLAAEGNLVRRWVRWVLAALAAFPLAVGTGLATLDPERSALVWRGLAGLAFALSCAATSLAVLAVFVRFAHVRTKVRDSLRDNAYAMYVIHYPFVSWLQYALLPSGLSALAKGSLVFLGTAALTWAASATLRRVPAIARVL